MDWLLNISLIVIFLICVLMSLASGMWGNLIMFFNVILAALIATSYFEPLAGFLEKQLPSFTYLWDFIALWGLFAASTMVLRTLTDLLSRVKVRFKKPVELVGGLLCGALVGWVMVCFTLFTMHTSPLAPFFMDGAFKPGQKMLFGLGPDLSWISFARQQSNPEKGALSGASSRADMFDPDGMFIARYGVRRGMFAREPATLTNKR
jgi:hypothetical protein